MQHVNFLETTVLVFGLTFSAGPANILLASSMQNQELRKTMPVYVGLWIPMILYTFATGFTFHSTLNEYDEIIHLIGLLGGCFIIYLGIKLYRTEFQANDEVENANKIFTFKDGFVLSALNSKLLISLPLTFSAGLSVYSNRMSVIIVISMFIVIGLLAGLTWMVMSNMIKHVLNQRFTVFSTSAMEHHYWQV